MGVFSLLSILSQLLRLSIGERVAEDGALLLSILSQLLLAVEAVGLDVVAKDAPVPFNSFPVAAEALASWLLINLSSANFEVHEISLALPSDT